MTGTIVTAPNFRMQIAAALMALYLFWGGTYLAMKVASETIPPFLISGLRFFAAGAVMYLWEWRKGTPHPSLLEWRGAAIVAGLLLVGSTGGLMWAAQYIPSGIAAIIFATVPLWMALIAWLFQKGNRPKGLILSGLSLGFCGVILLVKNSVSAIGGNPIECLSYIVVTLAAVSWAFGSLCSRSACLPKSPFMSVALQNLIGGMCCTFISFLAGEWNAFVLWNVSPGSAFSLTYLIIFGSLIGFGAYIWLLKVTDPITVSTYAYINPLVAVALGWALAGEKLASSDWAAVAVIVCAVVIITKNQSQPA